MSKAEQNQIENEMIFRRLNEKVGSDLTALDAMHKADGNQDLISDKHLLLDFKCECSDENCDERIPVRLSEYRKIHKDRDTFIVKTNHQVDSIENILVEKQGYSLVKKNESTPEPDNNLKHTAIDNS